MKTIHALLLIIGMCLFPIVADSAQHIKNPFGDNVLVFSPEDNMDTIHAIIDKIHKKMYKDQFSKDRYAIFFMPGDYRKAGIMNVPYYMQMSGLGRTPYEVKLHNVHTPAPLSNDNGTCTFYRSPRKTWHSHLSCLQRQPFHSWKQRHRLYHQRKGKEHFQYFQSVPTMD